MFYYLIGILYYLIPPCLYGAYRAWRRRFLPRSRKIIFCVASTVVLFIISVPLSLMNLYLPSVVAPVIGGVLSYFACGWVYKQIRLR